MSRPVRAAGYGRFRKIGQFPAGRFRLEWVKASRQFGNCWRGFSRQTYYFGRIGDRIGRHFEPCSISRSRWKDPTRKRRFIITLLLYVFSIGHKASGWKKRNWYFKKLEETFREKCMHFCVLQFLNTKYATDISVKFPFTLQRKFHDLQQVPFLYKFKISPVNFQRVIEKVCFWDFNLSRLETLKNIGLETIIQRLMLAGWTRLGNLYSCGYLYVFKVRARFTWTIFFLGVARIYCSLYAAHKNLLSWPD